MSLARTLVLGIIAGATILLGMPIGRIRRPARPLQALLNAIAVGVLLFLVWDVLSAAWAPIDSALASVHAGDGGLGPVLGYGVLFCLGLGGGLLGLVGYESWMARVHRGRPAVGSGTTARRLALLIAVGIGLHNFAEGLAIGQSAASGELSLATLLVIGFALHNATEGFGIVAPLAADRALDRAGGDDGDGSAALLPSWRFLLGLAAIGGGPTLVGTVVGHTFTSAPLAVVFLTLAAGSIIYVVIQLLRVADRFARRDLLAWGLLLGLLAGFATDAVVTAAGA